MAPPGPASAWARHMSARLSRGFDHRDGQIPDLTTDHRSGRIPAWTADRCRGQILARHLRAPGDRLLRPSAIRGQNRLVKLAVVKACAAFSDPRRPVPSRCGAHPACWLTTNPKRQGKSTDSQPEQTMNSNHSQPTANLSKLGRPLVPDARRARRAFDHESGQIDFGCSACSARP